MMMMMMIIIIIIIIIIITTTTEYRRVGDIEQHLFSGKLSEMWMTPAHYGWVHICVILRQDNSPFYTGLRSMLIVF